MRCSGRATLIQRVGHFFQRFLVQFFAALKGSIDDNRLLLLAIGHTKGRCYKWVRDTITLLLFAKGLLAVVKNNTYLFASFIADFSSGPLRFLLCFFMGNYIARFEIEVNG